MRWAVIVLVALARTSYADDTVTDLVAKGEALAKQGEFSSAIDAFKQADAKDPRAAHACLIGLVYTRRELWPQAELFLSRCRTRASDADPLPVWLPKVEKQLAEKLEADGAAAVTIVVTPTTANAKITVSSFAPDETFEPRTIHLAPGHHVIEVTADGFIAAQHEVVVDKKDPQTITIDLHTDAEQKAAAAASAAAVEARAEAAVVASHPQEQPRSNVPLAIMLGGVALGVAGGAVDLFVEKPSRDRLEQSPDTAIYEDRKSSFELRRDITIGLYAGAAVAVVTGLVLRQTVFAKSSITLSGSLDPHGAGVALSWSR
jgi:hypothetical protein